MLNLFSTNFKWSEGLDDKEKEIKNKINDSKNQQSKNINLLNQAQLESFNLHLNKADKYFGPEFLLIRNPKSIDKLYALTVNLEKEISNVPKDENLRNLFLGQHSINLAKTEKEISDLKMFVRTRYDLTTEVKKIPISERFYSNDIRKFNNVVHHLSIRKNINEVITNSQNKRSRANNLNFYRQLKNLQSKEMQQNIETKRNEDIYISSDKKSKTNVEKLKSNMYSDNIIITPLKNKSFDRDNQMKVRNDKLNQSPYTSTGMMIKNNLLKTNMFTMGITEDENSLKLFDDYFFNLKSYFYFKIKNQIDLGNQNKITTSGNLLYSQNELIKFNESSKKSNFIPISLVINDLLNFFSDKPEEKMRRRIFELLLQQINPQKYLLEKKLTINHMLINTKNYYEKEFLMKVLNLEIKETSNNTINEIIQVNNIDYTSKIQAIGSYVHGMIYDRKLIELKKSTNYNIIERLKIWGTIFYLMRCGLINDCKRFITQNKINDHELTKFEVILDQNINDNVIDNEIYSQLVETIMNKHQIESNPFRHACYSLVTKINQPVNENLLDTMEDYIWFHLNLIIDNQNFAKLKSENVLNVKYLTLKEFQDYIKSIRPQDFKSHFEFHLDYIESFFALLLYEDGLKYLSSTNQYIIDTVNISYILKEISLFTNFSSNILENNVIEANIPTENEYIINKWVEAFTETFMSSRLFPILNYAKFTYFSKPLEKMSQIFVSTGRYKELLTKKDLNFIFKGKSVSLDDMLSEKETQELVACVIHHAAYSEKRGHYEVLIELCLKYQIHLELLELIISDCVEVITAKTPQSIYRKEIHSKSNISNPKINQGLAVGIGNDITITDKYRKVLDKIGSNIALLDSEMKINFKMLRQLEIIEEIYDLIKREDYSKALEYFIKHISIIPFKSEKDVSIYLNTEFLKINDLLKKIIPDVIYLLFYLTSSKLKELNTSYSLKRNENMQSLKNEIDYLKKYISNISILIEKLLSTKTLKNADKFKDILKLIEDFTLKN